MSGGASSRGAGFGGKYEDIGVFGVVSVKEVERGVGLKVKEAREGGARGRQSQLGCDVGLVLGLGLPDDRAVVLDLLVDLGEDRLVGLGRFARPVVARIVVGVVPGGALGTCQQSPKRQRRLPYLVASDFDNVRRDGRAAGLCAFGARAIGPAESEPLMAVMAAEGTGILMALHDVGVEHGWY